MTVKAGVLSWDWREQPDLKALRNLIRDVSDGRLHLYEVDTGSDDYAIVLADRPLDAAAVDDVVGRWINRGEAEGLL